MKIITLSGSKGSGKTTALNTIQGEYVEAFEVMLAAKIKQTCADLLGLPTMMFENQQFKNRDLAIPVCIVPTLLANIFDAYGYSRDLVIDPLHRRHVGKMLYTPREVMQYVGTEILRGLDPDIHLKTAWEKAPKKGIMVVTDVRFPNELQFFKDKPEESLHLYISNLRAESQNQDTHASENHLKTLKKQCKIVYNDSTLEFFERELMKTVKDYLKL